MSTSASVEGSRVGRVIMRPLLPASLAANPSPPPLPPPSPLLLPPPGGGAATHSEAEAEAIISVDSDTVVILASLLCALICVAGLALVARCTCRLRSRSSSSTTGGQAPQAQEAPPCRAAAKRGLKKAAIEALPTMTMSASLESEAAECAICLAAFSEGDELRLLPHCAHAFHAACIDTWLAAHASCPSCRSTVLLTCRSCAAATVASHPLFAHDKEPSHEESTSSFT